jgi:DNA gyrase/topoisomerase IV subunit B
MSELKEQKIKKLSEKDHILLRSGMYLGSSTLTTSKEYIKSTIDNKDYFNLQSISYVPGLVKIFNELIDNSIDEYVRTKGKFANKIDITINETEFRVVDNGRGIPVKKVDTPEGEIYQPELAWTHARAGSNFEDENSTTIGTNGVGSMIASVFSKEFIGISNDGENKCTVRCSDNNDKINTKVGKPTGKQGTQVTIIPDVERFGLSEITSEHILMIEQRLYNLSVSYPGIAFKFNGKTIKLNAKKFLNMFGENGTIVEEDNFSIGVFHSDTDDFKQFSLMNGLTLSAGGTHVDYITNNMVRVLKDKIAKKYKSIKPNDVKRKLFVVTILKDFKGPKYETQTKEKLTNPLKDIAAHLGGFDLNKFAEKVYRNKSVIDSIIDYFRIAEEYKKKQDMKGLEKTKKKIKSEKYTKAVGENKVLVVCEGASAKGGLMPILGRDGIAYYELKGKPLNAYSATHAKFTSNKELTELFQIIKNEDFDYVITGTDQDLDGISIASLLVGFYKKYIPEDLKNGKFGRLQTPIFFTRGKDKKPKDWFYNLRDIPSEKGDYMKGLGSWEQEDLEHIIQTDGIEKMIDIFDDTSDETIEEWLGDDSAPRKKYIQANDFELIKI